MSFKAEGKWSICSGCGARIRNATADRIEHLTTPSRHRAEQKRRTTKPTTEQEAS